MAIYRVTAEWSGFPGAPGYSNFHFSEFTGGIDAEQVRGRVEAFFEPLKTVLASAVTITIPPTVEILDEDTGMLTGWMDGGEEIRINTTGTAGDYAGPSGAVINWITGTVRNGRRVRGRTFLVPIRSGAYDSDGTLTSDALTSIREAGDEFVTQDFNSGFGVWSRPSNGSGGIFAPVTGYRVPDMVAVLRSRRD